MLTDFDGRVLTGSPGARGQRHAGPLQHPHVQPLGLPGAAGGFRLVFLAPARGTTFTPTAWTSRAVRGWWLPSRTRARSPWKAVPRESPHLHHLLGVDPLRPLRGARGQWAYRSVLPAEPGPLSPLPQDTAQRGVLWFECAQAAPGQGQPLAQAAGWVPDALREEEEGPGGRDGHLQLCVQSGQSALVAPGAHSVPPAGAGHGLIISCPGARPGTPWPGTRTTSTSTARST